jgi:hypothetical protein
MLNYLCGFLMIHHASLPIGLIVHLLPKRKTKAKRNLEPIDMLLVTLQFYATGTFQSVVGNVLRYSQSSVCRSISIISLALAMISKKKIAFPADLLTVRYCCL